MPAGRVHARVDRVMIKALLGASLAAAQASAQLTDGLARSGASGASHLARAVRAVPSAAVQLLAAAGGADRQVWSAQGRAQIEVRGLDEVPSIASAVEDAVDELGGVAWARVDVATRRVVLRFDPARVGVDELISAVADVEARFGVQNARYPAQDASFPGDQRPVTLEALALAADLAGLVAASAARLGRLPSLPGGVAAAVVLIDYQPRLRQVLEHRLGPVGTDLGLAIATAAAHGVSRGVPSLVVDTAQRAHSLAAARSRRAGFTEREAELCGPHRESSVRPSAYTRPVPMPAGPVEKLSDRAAVGSLLGAAGLLLVTGRLRSAGDAVQIGAPKAARAGREAFADTLGVGLTRRGLVVGDPSALRRLDRVSAVLVDSGVLLADRPLIVDAWATAEGWSREHVWGTGQRLLAEGPPLSVPPPAGRQRRRVELVGDPRPASGQLASLRLLEDGEPVGELRVGRELDPYADAVLTAAQQAGIQLILTADPSTVGIASRADHVLTAPTSTPGTVLRDQVARLQTEGHVVAVVSSDAQVLAAADVGIAVLTGTGPVPWGTDVLCGPGLTDVATLLASVSVARGVSERGVSLSLGATFLGALLALVGSGRRGGATLPVNVAAGSALVSGTLAARPLVNAPPPLPVLHTPWHALEPDEVTYRLPVAAAPEPVVEGSGTPRPGTGLVRTMWAAAAGGGRLADNVRAELADPLTPVLATGAAASAVIGSPTDALLVGGVLAANAVISGAQRLRAEQALQSLLIGQQLTARVITPLSDGIDVRLTASGPTRSRPAARLTAGDLIELVTGDVVPADARLVTATDLELDEASLTGESVAVPKQVQATPGAELADRACMVYEGTSVLAGTGRAIVVATGAATEAGRAVNLAGHAAGPAGMQARLEELTRRGLPITLLGGAAVTGLGLLRRQPLRSAIASGVSVAVAAVPEGLPLVATVAQLSAARRLSQRGILVRSARTVEALGRVDTVCFDKTGTLTEGRLRLVRAAGLDAVWDLDAPQAARVLRAAAQACPQPGAGQPVPHATDRAVLDGVAAALSDHTDPDWEELSELPFHSDRGYSAALGRSGDQLRLVVKGAPEVLLTRCTHVRDQDGKRRLTTASRRQAEDTVQSLAAQGLRVLAVARRTFDTSANLDDPSASTAEGLAEDLTLLGFIALADVARPQAAPTIAALHAAGLATVMITGDHPVTAHAIATSLGIPADRIITGPELAGLDDAARTALVTQASVFARVSPEQKLRIIAALQKAGRVVAMTGDGANDAAAIRLADVGIGMAAHGSSSARNAADLVFTDPDVSLILDALVEGRAMWRRVRDAVAILLGGNAGEVGFTLAGTALAGRAPIGTRQFLLVNMLTDLLPAMAIALAATPHDAELRRDLLAAGAPSLGKPLLRDIGLRGATTAAGALTAWQIGRVTGRPRRASTIALGALVGTQLGQTLVVGGRNPLVLATGIGSAVVMVGIIQTPGLSRFFGCTPLGPVAWTTVVGCSTGATGLSVLAPHVLRGTKTSMAADAGKAVTQTDVGAQPTPPTPVPGDRAIAPSEPTPPSPPSKGSRHG